jgi:predicted GNAT superfamily acetyltransferase
MIRDAAPRDFPTILALNAESVHFLSPLDSQRLLHLHAQAAYHRVVEIDGAVAAFLLVLREGADYDSPNYRWFAEHHPQFLYIDRVVVDTRFHGRGLAAQLYADLIDFASAANVAQLSCEFDLDPPNPVSAKFHARHGFIEVGRQWLGGGKKQVSLQVRPIPPA